MTVASRHEKNGNSPPGSPAHEVAPDMLEAALTMASRSTASFVQTGRAAAAAALMVLSSLAATPALAETTDRVKARARLAEGAKFFAEGSFAKDTAAGQSLPDPGWSSGVAQAEALIREATELRRAGKDARAYPLFQKAYEVEPTPRTAAQLGLVEIQLGYWLLAERHLLEALAFPRDPWIASNRISLGESLTRAREAIGEVVIVGSPLGANVRINGRPAGNLPLPAPIRVGEGPVKVEVWAAGYIPVQRSLTLHGGKRHEIAIELQREPPAIAASQNAPAGEERAGASSQSPTDGHGFGAIAGPVGWTVAALAAGTFAIAAFQTAQWQNANQEFARHTGTPTAPGQAITCGIREQNRGALGCSAIYSTLERAKERAFVGYAAGGLLAAGAVTLLLISGKYHRRSSSLACGVSPGFTGGGCRLAF